ncbi:hypothetical protein ACS0TY_028976 [Phlomoides rotata]
MGKSAGKWIKTVLFGKKHSKSNYSKNVTTDKKNGEKTPIEDLARDSSVISDPCQMTERGAESLELENGISRSQCDAISVAHVGQGVDSQSDDALVPVSDDEMRRQYEAAMKTQAVFRGYLARRAFRALKGIIRLQALIRGHLVRRQAVATLRCMHAIVKLQALARGRRVRLSDAMPEFIKKFNVGEHQVAVGAHPGSFLSSEILAVHPFIHKLVIALPNPMPLSLQYDQSEPNSASNWLELWSASHFWEPPPRSKKVTKAKPQRKQGGTQIGDSEAGKSKRTIRKVSTAGHGETGNSASSEMDKPRRNPRKVTSSQTQTEVVQEQSVSELERVKRSLRKVSASAAAAPEKQEPETEKPQPLQSVEIVMSSASPDVSEQEIVTSSGNQGNSDVVVAKLDPVEAPLDIAEVETVDMQHDRHPAIEINPLENDAKMETAVPLDDELSSKEEQSRKENQKIRKRRSLPAKQEYPENISQNSPSVPSYMAATESAKAKLRAQGAVKFAEDVNVAVAVPDYGNARRHSLPASTNGKLSSLSPRIQKPAQANGKGGNKISKSLTPARDDKVVQPGWRR